HFYENVGTPSRPMFSPPVCVEAEGKPIRVYRDGVFGGKHWHGMAGYPLVAYVDWDKDGLFDLIVPNETNRVFWFRNVGELGRPRFGERRQILPDGFSDSDEKLERTRRLAGDKTVPNHPYPLEEDIPFFWRSRPAIADYTGDGLEDIIALNGMKNLVLYERYRSPGGALGLKSAGPLFYEDDVPIQNPHFSKLRDVDWDEDGLMDIVATQNLFSADQRSLLFLKNVGTKQKPVFARPEAIKLWGETIRYSAHGLQPSFVDWEGDGSLDFVGCNESGFFVLFRRAALTHPKPRAAITQ
ncbi:MAG: FG-GAP-like repeat-containing protein, partial [Acidobacteriota bacterium]|nr:FG-GAP-like repeat-containing protein [Acidobacteriota bacterium]